MKDFYRITKDDAKTLLENAIPVIANRWINRAEAADIIEILTAATKRQKELQERKGLKHDNAD